MNVLNYSWLTWVGDEHSLSSNHQLFGPLPRCICLQGQGLKVPVKLCLFCTADLLLCVLETSHVISNFKYQNNSVTIQPMW
ncbi:hypothetical protein E2C01_067958 [Portunus trituberculatus]|uniref:Uncharacterized protein n=1 Tax=Portunus trituberculatus TaxID=210409 RepID=A0A5B7HQR1_PORTR|nr:hypothetical protein [Portunus trituberculatus]